MVKRTTKQSPPKGSRTSFRVIKRQAKARVAVEEASSKARNTLVGRDARADERFRELVAWYMLQGMDEATARQRARDEVVDDPRKD
jgi:hypothetical protein